MSPVTRADTARYACRPEKFPPASHGPALLGLGYDLCWATTWMDTANRWIGPVVGLPELPYVDFGDRLFGERPDGVFVTARHPGPALLRHVNPRLGLREGDFAALAEFAAAVRA